MSLLEITGLSHSFGDNSIFSDAGFSLNKGEHVGIVGQNGVGKSTLLKICTEQIIPDAGRIVWHPKTTVGWLDQYAEIEEGVTIKIFLQSVYSHLYEKEQKMLELYEQAEDGNMSRLIRAAKLQEELETQDFYTIDTRIEQITSGLGLMSLGLDQKIMEMSGGQRAKVILAKLLLEKPDVMLLDEPTNFLDKEHITWLANYLSALENAYLVISHDNDFLERISHQICDIDNRKITKYHGTHSEFLKKKTMLRDDYIRKYTAQQKEIKKTEEFIRRNIAGRKTRMAKGRRKQLDRMDKIEALNQKEIKPVFPLSCSPVTTAQHLIVEDLCVGYNNPVLSGLNFSIKGGHKIVLTGFNGVGKSTLLKTLTGQLPAIEGNFSFHEQVILGYYEQDLVWHDNLLTPIEIVSNTYPALSSKEVRRELFRCGISSKHAMQAINTLSGGEQAKVKMCLLINKSCNFLILDEPTNHLDVQAKDALQAALSNFEGTVLLVSHEEHFYQSWAQEIINLHD